MPFHIGQTTLCGVKSVLLVLVRESVTIGLGLLSVQCGNDRLGVPTREWPSYEQYGRFAGSVLGSLGLTNLILIKICSNLY